MHYGSFTLNSATFSFLILALERAKMLIVRKPVRTVDEVLLGCENNNKLEGS